jgi:hypothetical protein
MALAVRKTPEPLGSAYDADGLEAFGLGPGLTVLIGRTVAARPRW